MFWSTQPATMEKQKRRTKTAAWWTFTEGKEREGKGSEWRSASGRRQLQTRTQDHGFLPKPPHTTHDVDRPPTGAVGAWNAPSVPRAC